MFHELKTVNPHFNNLELGIKTFEIRKNDRNYQVNDTLILKEYDLEKNEYTGKKLKFKVTHIINNFSEGLKENYCIMSIKKLLN